MDGPDAYYGRVIFESNNFFKGMNNRLKNQLLNRFGIDEAI